MEDNVRNRMYIYMCDWVTLLYSRKLTEHCKPAKMEKNKNHLKKKKELRHLEKRKISALSFSEDTHTPCKSHCDSKCIHLRWHEEPLFVALSLTANEETTHDTPSSSRLTIRKSSQRRSRQTPHPLPLASPRNWAGLVTTRLFKRHRPGLSAVLFGGDA